MAKASAGSAAPFPPPSKDDSDQPRPAGPKRSWCGYGRAGKRVLKIFTKYIRAVPIWAPGRAVEKVVFRLHVADDRQRQTVKVKKKKMIGESCAPGSRNSSVDLQVEIGRPVSDREISDRRGSNVWINCDAVINCAGN